MFGCSDTANLHDDDEALDAPPQEECFGLVPRVCFSLLNRLEEANTGKRSRRGGHSASSSLAREVVLVIAISASHKKNRESFTALCQKFHVRCLARATATPQNPARVLGVWVRYH